MSHDRKSVIVEAKVLDRLQRGSYEELLQNLDRVVSENQELFGVSDSVLFASYSDHIIVMNEGGRFFKVGFTNKDGLVELKHPEPLDVEVLSESDVVTKGVEGFFQGGSLSEGLRGVINLRKSHKESLLEKTQQALSVLLSGGKVWRDRLAQNKENISSFAWDAEFGDLKIDMPVFGEMLEADDVGDDILKQVIEGLMVLEQRLFRRLNQVKIAYEDYQQQTLDMRDDERDEVMSQFESFTSDYIDHLSEIANFVSEAVLESHGNCVDCSVLVHDEVAKVYKELELGGRFVRKIAAQFKQ